MSNSIGFPYRLALDLGSTSLGWAVFRLAPTQEDDYKLKPTAIIKAGVRIFSDGRNPKDGSSLAVTRRNARAMRRRRDRLLKRKKRMEDKLVQYGFFPQDKAARKMLELLNPYELRAKGLGEALTPGEFARALFHINQRRGFKSNRKTDSKENDSGALKAAISALRSELQSQQAQLPAGETMTVGRLLWQRMEQNLPVRARYREVRVPREDGKTRIEKSYDLYIDRQMIADEFDALWAKQAALNPALFTEAARVDLRDTLLFQRKLRPVTPGRCTLIPEEPRAPLALPSQQRFRMYQEVNNLRLLDESNLQQRALSRTERDQIVEALELSGKRTFAQLHKLLGLPGTARFNLEDENRKELKGNATSASLSRKDLFGPAWHQFDHALQDEIVWQLVTEESEAQLMQWLQQRTGISAERAAAVANAGLPEGYGSLSRQALAQIVPALIECDMVDGVAVLRTYDKAVQAAGFAHHSDLGFDFDSGNDEVELVGERTIESTGEIKPAYAFKALPYYGRALQRHVAFAKENPRNDEERYGKIANPTVHIGLNQVRVVVNALIKRYGHPTEIVVELARDLKQSQEQKRETQRRQTDNQKRNERIRKEIATLRGISEDRVKHADIQKWILWEELSFDVADRRCPYSGVQISATMLLGDEVEIEHILPFYQTLDDSLNNRTVSMRSANRIKGNSTPWDAREDFERQGWSYEGIELRASRMPKAKRYRFAADGYQQWLRDDKGFLARALNDTRYLSRVAREYLTLVCPNIPGKSSVRVIPGQMTALLRAKFGLNDVLGLNGEKNRNDHRHHAVDACVIGVTDQGLLQRFANASADARGMGLEKLVNEMPLPWKTYRDHVERAVRHIWVSHKPDHGYEGAILKETAYGIKKDGAVRQKCRQEDKKDREISDVIRINEPRQPVRHGVNDEGVALAYKGYQSGGTYCIQITCNAKRKWEGEVVRTYEAYARHKKLLRHYQEKFGLGAKAPALVDLIRKFWSDSAPRLIMHLIKGDTVLLEDQGQLKLFIVVSINSAGRITLAPHQDANVDARNSSKEDPFSYTYKMSGTLQKAKARRVTISPIGELRDPGFKD